MGMTLKAAIILVVIFLSMAALLYMGFDRILIYFVSKAYDVTISYSDFEMRSLHKFIFNDLSIVNKKTGFGLFARYADIEPEWHRGAFFKNLMIDFKLQDVNFLREVPAEHISGYDTLYKLISVPFDSNWTYGRIVGKIGPSDDGMNITDLTATSDDIRLSFTGTIFSNQTLDSSVMICFSDKVTSNIPLELSTVVLQNEANGWKSLSVKLAGDYRAPSIQLSNKLFRLNIKMVYEPEVARQD